MPRASVQQQLIDDVAGFARDPLAYVLYAFPWGQPNTGLESSAGPRRWQGELLEEVGQKLQEGHDLGRLLPLLFARASGHGIGKSTVAAWIVLWALSTMPDTRVVVTANTETQLRTKTWPELAKWARLAINRHWFRTQAASIAAADPAHERVWRADAIPWSEVNTEAFAGLHNQGRRIVLIFDEASAIADKIWEVSEGALTDEDTEIFWFAFGNPTRNSGRFKECFGRLRHRWNWGHVDSRDVDGTNKEQIAKWIEDYGEDSDFVRVRVRGIFPRAGTMQFIASELVEQAMARDREPMATIMDPLIMGVDVARFGDDRSVIRFRRGRDARTIPPIKLRNVDTMTLAARIADEAAHHRPDAIFIDEGGVGGGVVDRCRYLRLPVTGVQFGAAADRAMVGQDGAIVYANKRAEMWGNMREWLGGGALDDDRELLADLVGVEYGYTMREGRDAIILERKEDMKKRGLASPDDGDALALTFAYPVAPSDHTAQLFRRPMHQYEYDPYAEFDKERERADDPYAAARRNAGYWMPHNQSYRR